MSRCGRALAATVVAGMVCAATLVAVPSASATSDLVLQEHKVSAPAPAPAPPTGAALATLAKPPVRSSIASQRIYFVMTDRYANGDPANDRGGRTGTRGVTGFDPADTGWFHGGDFRGLTGGCTTGTGLARIKALGFTAVWVTPPFGQKAVQGSSAAYHGYWIRDFTSVDPHLGTEQDFAAFVDVRAPARAEGLRRRRRQPHRRRDRPQRQRLLDDAVPRLPRQGVRPGALRGWPHRSHA